MEKKAKQKKFEKVREMFSHVNKVAFFICLLVSIALIITAFFIPPMAVIDASVIASVGELFAFAALGVVIDGISRGKQVMIQKGETTLTLNDKDKEE